ncbi:MAG: hypothetical protein JXA82_12820 [Sedimentisphaerales bacterium]|nr:hypothetical protein [Sedimentisphaerales bacterium]
MRKKLFWFPARPVLRTYDQYARIPSETTIDFHADSKLDETILRLTISKGFRLEFPLVVFNENTQLFLNQLSSMTSVETHFTAKHNWFRYTGINDAWNYFVAGDLYHPSTPERPDRVPCQLCAHTLYNHFLYLEEQTKKNIYSILREMIAYSVMLSLPDDRKWKQGTWSHIPETHARLQADGIHLLLTHHEQTRHPAFLAKAIEALEGLLEFSNPLADNGLWFLHDSLELNETPTYPYQNRLASRVFGKSLGNTLCLNTHIWTLILLIRINRLSPDSRFQEASERGMMSLEKVLTASPTSFLYRLVYAPRDCLTRFAGSKRAKRIRILVRKYDHVLKRYVLPCMKSRFPRLVMPNGFIERDLIHAHLAMNYFFINMKDLLLLFAITHDNVVRKVVQRSVQYTIRNRVAQYCAVNHEYAAMFQSVLALYRKFISNDFAEEEEEFNKLSLPRYVGLEGYPWLTSFCPEDTNDNPR